MNEIFQDSRSTLDPELTPILPYIVFSMTTLRAMSIIILITISTYSFGNEQRIQFKPALVKGGNIEFTNRFGWPKEIIKDSFNVVFICNLYVNYSGVVQSVGCVPAVHKKNYLDKKELKHLRIESENTIFDLKFTPATVDKKKVSVLIYLRSMFVCKHNICQIHMALNRGISEDIYGFNYVAPQQIQKGIFIYEMINDWFDFDVRRSKRTIFFEVSTNVDNLGNHSGHIADREFNGSALKLMKKKSLTKMDTFSYIPGFYEGTPVAMKWRGWISRNILNSRY